MTEIPTIKRSARAKQLKAGAPARSLRQDQRDFSRQRILAAALEAFSTIGYQSATVEDIAALAGTSRANFYLYFKGKREIIAALVEENIEAFREIYAAVPLDSAASTDVIEKWVDQIFDFYAAMRQRVIVYRQATLLDPDVQAMSERNYTAMIEANWYRLAGDAAMDSAEGQVINARFRLFMGLVDSAAYLSKIVGAVDERVSRVELINLWHQFWGRAR